MPEQTLFFKDKITLPPTEMDYVEKNPEGLTKEGVEHNLKSWKRESRNKYIIRRYEIMLKTCKSFTPSGKTIDGRTVLSRNNDGKVTWSEKLEV